jgi:hypothetical protein
MAITMPFRVRQLGSGVGGQGRKKWLAILAVGLLASVTACGGSTPSTTHPSAALGGQSTVAPTGRATSTSYGTPVTVTSSQGYRFEVSAGHPRGVTTVVYQGSTFDAAPGKLYVAVDAQIRNPTDRQEPYATIADLSQGTPLYFAIPKASSSAFGNVVQGFPCADNPPAGYCLPIGLTVVSSITPGDPTGQGQLQPGGKESQDVLLVSAYAVPESAPIGEIALFFQFLTGPAATRVPLGN